MPRVNRFYRRLRDALPPAIIAAAAGFGVTWLLLLPPFDAPSQPAAVLRVRQTGDRSATPMDEAVARLLGSESLAETLSETGLPGRGVNGSAMAEMAERMRESVHVDIRVPDEAGVQEVKIRWVGDPREAAAGKLVSALCRRLAAGLAATGPSPAAAAERRHQYEASRLQLAAAETALADARAEFEAALNEPVRVHAAGPDHPQATVDPSANSSIEFAEADELQLARQRLAELEQRRRLLADRLMPEHPEMRALEEKIDDLRSAVAGWPQPAPRRQPPAELRADSPTIGDADHKRLSRSGQLWRAVLGAQNRYAAALARERECRLGLAPNQDPLVAEIESPPATTAISRRAAGWRQWLPSTLVALFCGGVVLAVWPDRRQTLASAEEVRAITRLPVVVLESAALN